MPPVQIKKLHTLTGHQDCVYTLQQAEESSFFFSGAGDGMVVMWNLDHPEEGERIAQLPNSIYALHLLKKENLLVAGHNYEGIHMLDYKQKKEVASIKLSTAAIFDISSYNTNLFIASGDGSISVIDIASMNVRKKLSFTSRSARTIAVCPERGEMAVGYSDNRIRIFSLDDFRLMHDYEAHLNSVFTLSYSPNHKFLLSGSRDARLKVWKTEEDYGLETEISAHLYAINHMAFSPDGEHFVTCSMDKSVKVWQTDSLELLKVIDKARHAGHGTSVNKVLWSSFNNQLVTASDDRSISVWDVIF